MRVRWLLLIALGLPVPGSLVRAQFGEFARTPFGDSRDYVTVSVIPDRTRVAPGDQVRVAVVFDHREGFHIHTQKPEVPPELGRASDYFATVIEVEGPEDGRVRAHPQFIQWPDSHEIEVHFSGAPVKYKVFDGKAVAFVPVVVSSEAALGPVKLKVKPGFQACDDKACFPATPYPARGADDPEDERWADYGYEVGLEIVPLAEAQGRETIDPALFGAFSEGVWDLIRSGAEFVEFDLFGWKFRINAGSGIGLVLLWLVAAVGGLLLNFTPCVLPVIPLKIMGLSQSAGDRGRMLYLGMAMVAGIVAFWVLLGGLIAGVGSFTSTNQLFQYPAFTIGVGVVIAAMAVGMCGLFTVRLPQFVYRFNPRHDSFKGSFLFGVMTAVLSTPCTAPFMGAAAAWAATQSGTVTLATFAFIGAGMAAPYLVLAAFPALVSRMPRTGPASELIKQVMGLLMLAAAAYFAGVGLSGALATPPDPSSRLYWWVVCLFLLGAGCWMAWRTLAIAKSAVKKVVFVGLGVGLALLSVLGAVALTDRGPINWIYYTPERFAEAKQAGKIVVMEFTAEWCLNCKGLEESVLKQEDVVRLLNSAGVAPIKVDLTGNNKPGNAMLKQAGRLTIPLLVIYRPDGRELFKGDFYTVNQLIEVLGKELGE